MEEKCYEMKLLCSNCKSFVKYEILFGKKIEDFSKENSCENCGCYNTLSYYDPNEEY